MHNLVTRKSISEAFIHAGAANDCKVNVKWIHSEKLTKANIKEVEFATGRKLNDGVPVCVYVC